MWGAFSSDFKEFVSGVTEDTSTVLSKIDAGLNNGDESDEGASAPQTPSAPLLSGEKEEAPGTGVSAESSAVSSSFVSEESEDVEDEISVSSTAIEEVLRMLIEHPGTFKDPLINEDTSEEEKAEVEEFLKNFSIDSKTDEIAKLLHQDDAEEAADADADEDGDVEPEKEAEERVVDDKDDETKEQQEPKDEAKEEKSEEGIDGEEKDGESSPTTELNLPDGSAIILKEQFETLVPTEVSYKEFWERFYYRCDVDRIKKDYVKDYEQQVMPTQALSAGVSKFTNFFGGAVAAVSKKLTEADTEKPANSVSDGAAAGGIGGLPDPRNLISSMQSSVPVPNQQTTAAALSIFGNAGRPPFVMNTAVSSEADDEEEEEELGWDDDDDDDDDMDDNNHDSGSHDGMVEFTSDMDIQLKQTQNERDQFMETVQLQKKEIITLKKKLGEDVDPSEEEEIKNGQNEAITKLKDEIDALRIEIFEKDSEIAALKSRLDDHDHDHAKENDAINDIASKKEYLKLSILTKQIMNLSPNQMNKLKMQVFGNTDSSVEDQNLQNTLKATEEKLHKAERELDQLRQSQSLSPAMSSTNSAVKVENLPPSPINAPVTPATTGAIADDGEEEDDWGDDWE